MSEQTNLTRAQIAALTPEQLRLAVAEHVMGGSWRPVEAVIGTNYEVFDLPGKSYAASRRRGEVHILEIPDYPAAIAAAWLVHKATLRWHISQRILYERFLVEMVTVRTLAKLTDIEAALFMEPIDICRAALLATVAE